MTLGVLRGLRGAVIKDQSPAVTLQLVLENPANLSLLFSSLGIRAAAPALQQVDVLMRREVSALRVVFKKQKA